MDPTQLQEFLRSESDRVEWKESAKSADDVLHPACALANDLGGSRQDGFVLFGVNKRGEVTGIDDRGQRLDKVQQQIASRLTSTAIYPTPSFDLEVVEWSGKILLALRVHPYQVPPVVTVNTVAWVRKGTTTQRATDADLSRLRERRPEAARPFDTRCLHEAMLDDLEITALGSAYEADRDDDQDPETFPSLEAWLSNRRGLGAPVDGVWRPTAAAVLLHGKSPQDWLPGAVVEFVRYAGGDVDSAISARRTAAGTLPNQLEVLWAQIAAHLDDLPIAAAGIRAGFSPRFPVEVLKELARNLVQHRQYEGTHAPGRVEWFDDRIELSNPGAPFGRASEGEFGEHSDYRNPSITKGLVELGYVEQLGRGIRRCRLALARNGCPDLEVETDGYTRVIVKARP
jgi:ATP-dependent DNA helicase RecG